MELNELIKNRFGLKHMLDNLLDNDDFKRIHECPDRYLYINLSEIVHSL